MVDETDPAAIASLAGFGDVPDRPPDPWFNPYRQPATDRACAIARDVAGQLQVVEKCRGLRARRRKARDQETFEEIVAAVVADVIHHYLSGSPGDGLVVSRSKKILGRASRYRPPVFAEGFRHVLNLLSSPEMEFVQQRVGQQLHPARRTTIKADTRLVSRIEEHGLTFADLTLSDAEEVIILKKPKAHFLADRADLQEYDDTDTTRRYRDEVRAINAWLANADISFDGAAAAHGLDAGAAGLVAGADASERRLRRYFTLGSFESGGRLFGGFWQGLPKDARLRGLRIDGEPVVSLDYSQLNPRTAYSIAGTKPAEGDAYTLPGLEDYRDGVKRVFNAMLFATKRLQKVPRGVRAELPKKVTIHDITSGLLAKHPGLLSVFHTGSGHRLMWIESEIMVRVLLSLEDRRVLGLPVFDAVVAKASEEQTVRQVMEECFHAITGLTVVVKREER